jgi:hypothetical protein
VQELAETAAGDEVENLKSGSSETGHVRSKDRTIDRILKSVRGFDVLK